MTNWNQSLAKDSHIELIRVIGGGPAGLIFALLNAHEKQKIVIHENENKLTGEELVIVAKKDLAFLNFSLRFHVTPEGKLIQTQGGDILLSVDNQGWRFKSSHPVKIEDSLYFASYDKILESKCILVEGTLKDKVNNINWALEKTN